MHMKSKRLIARSLYFLLLFISNCREDDDDVVRTLVPAGILTTAVISSSRIDLQWLDKSSDVAPSSLTASVISGTQINLSWVDNSADELGFRIERAITGGSTFGEIATVGSPLQPPDVPSTPTGLSATPFPQRRSV